MRSCDTAFRPGGNIIEHYVYRFVAAGRACLVSNLAKSCRTECYDATRLLLFLSVFSFFQRSVGKSLVRISVFSGAVINRLRKLLGICRRSFGTVRQGSLEEKFFENTTRRVPIECVATGAHVHRVRDKRSFSVYLQLPAIKKQVLETVNRFDVDVGAATGRRRRRRCVRRSRATPANHDTRVSSIRF